jgi:DNA-binding transcriptional LysR family regulator
MPELAALEVLLTVARTGSFNATAAELGVTQQAISARISALEAQTGVSLVVRGPRGSELTHSGVVVGGATAEGGGRGRGGHRGVAGGRASAAADQREPHDR